MFSTTANETITRQERRHSSDLRSNEVSQHPSPDCQHMCAHTRIRLLRAPTPHVARLQERRCIKSTQYTHTVTDLPLTVPCTQTLHAAPGLSDRHDSAGLTGSPTAARTSPQDTPGLQAPRCWEAPQSAPTPTHTCSCTRHHAPRDGLLPSADEPAARAASSAAASEAFSGLKAGFVSV